MSSVIMHYPPHHREEYPSAWVNIMMLLASGQDFYNQNSYTLGVTYNGVDYDSTSTRAIAAPECIDVKGAGIYSNTYKTPLSVAVVLNLNCQ